MDEAKAAHITVLSMPSPDEAKTTRAANLLKTQAETAQAQAATQKDTEATKQFNVMQSAISTYRASVRGISPTDEHAAIMSRILSDKNIFGGLGENVLASIGEGRTNDVLTAMRKAANWNTLTPEEQQATVDYLRARTAVPLVQKALTGVGRMNAEVMKLDMQMIPSPIEGRSADMKPGAFQKTIDGAAQGLTRVPWLPTPQDVRNAIETKDTQESKNQLAAQQHFAEYRAQNGPGQYRGTPSQDTGKKRYEVGMVAEGLPGGPKTVTKVYPDGSFDAK